MSELEPYLPHAPAPTGKLASWVADFKGVAEVSAAIARTRFAPESLYVWRERDGRKTFDAEATTAQVAAVIMTGQELGMSPMAALRSVDIIQGQPALRAIALRAVLLAQGHEIYVESATATRAVVVGQRRGSDHEQRLEWNMDMARARNLAGKPNWRTQPRNMLIARATADVARLIAADALLGLPYVVEELEDGVTGVDTIGGTTDSAPAPGRRTRRPAALSAPRSTPEPATHTDTPPLDETPTTAAASTPDEPPLDDPDPAAPGITAQQQKRLHALIRERFGNHRRGTPDHTKVLNHLSETIGRAITSTNELTSTEASLLITELTPGPSDPTEPDHEPAASMTVDQQADWWVDVQQAEAEHDPAALGELEDAAIAAGRTDLAAEARRALDRITT